MDRDGCLDALMLQRIGQRLRGARRAAGMTVEQLAHDAGVDRRRLVLAERGRANLQLGGELLPLVAALGTYGERLLEQLLARAARRTGRDRRSDRR